MSNWIAQYMDIAVDVFREKKKSLGFYYVGYYVLMMIIFFALLLVFGIMAAVGIAVTTTNDSTPNMVLIKLLGVLLVIVTHGFMQNIKVGIAAIGAIRHTKREIKAAEAVKIAFKRLLKCFGLVSVIDFPLILIGWFATDLFMNASFLERFGKVLTLWFKTTGDSPLLMGLLVLTLVTVLIVIMLLLTAYYTWFNFAFYSILFEKKSVFSAISMSFKRIKNQYWKIYWATVVINLTYWAMMYAMTGILQALTLASQLILGFAPVVGVFLVQAVSSINMIVSVISGIIGTSILVIANGELYWQARHLDTADDLIRTMQTHMVTLQSKEISFELTEIIEEI